MKAQIVRLPARLTLEETEAMGAKRAYTYAVHWEHTLCRWVDTSSQQRKYHTELTKKKVATTTNDTGFALLTHPALVVEVALKVLFL